MPPRLLALLLAATTTGAAETVPAIAFTPGLVQVTRDLRGEALAGGSYERQPFQGKGEVPDDPRTPTERTLDESGECALIVHATIGDGWSMAFADQPSGIAATTSAGERLVPVGPVPEHERSVRQAPLREAAAERSIQLRLRLRAPRQPALALSEVHGAIDVILARTDRLVRREYRPVAGGAPLPGGIDACDLTVARGASDEIVIDHHPWAMLRVHAIDVLDASGEPCNPKGGRSGMEGGRRQLALRYDPAPACVAIAYYATPQRARVHFALADIPLVGAPAAPPAPVAATEIEILRSPGALTPDAPALERAGF